MQPKNNLVAFAWWQHPGLVALSSVKINQAGRELTVLPDFPDFLSGTAGFPAI
jgi:hypothetical protein